MTLIEFILINYGLTQIITVGAILDRIRPKYLLFHCAMCMGFWIGMLVWYISHTDSSGLLDVFFHGCIGSGTAYFMRGVTTIVTQKKYTES